MRKTQSSPELITGFLTMARLKLEYLHIDKKFKVGVIAYHGDTNEDVILKSNKTPEQFNEFLDVLGRKVKLLGFNKFSGGLDTKRDRDGEYSIHTESADAEIMFHVSTLLGEEVEDKKIHLGNDAVVIVYSDGNRPFNPDLIATKFNQVFIVVSKISDADLVETIEKRIETPSSRAKSKSLLSSPDSLYKSFEFEEWKQQMGFDRKKTYVSRLNTKAHSKGNNNDQLAHTFTWYRVCVLRRDGVPSFEPKPPWPYPIFRPKQLRDYLIAKITNAMVASYRAPVFQQRILQNRKTFLERILTSQTT